ncbi:MAG: signal peptidase II [Candidatus Riflebacteria bacterium]|nr:signal peptidase II [Candidatus Riflebacteria bacterium]
MKTLKNAFIWAKDMLKAAFYTVAVYPIYLLKNIGYHFRSPSVLLYAVIFFIIDRVTKYLVVSNAHLLPKPVIDNFFTLRYVRNPGVAFGWFPEWKLPPIIMAISLVAIIVYYSLKVPEEDRMTRWALALLVGGALGNLYDRLVYGFVVDFLLFHFGSFDFPVFNFADMIIDLGVFILFIDIFFLSPELDEEDEKKLSNDAPAPSLC